MQSSFGSVGVVLDTNVKLEPYAECFRYLNACSIPAFALVAYIAGDALVTERAQDIPSAHEAERAFWNKVQEISAGGIDFGYIPDDMIDGFSEVFRIVINEVVSARKAVFMDRDLRKFTSVSVLPSGDYTILLQTQIT